MRAVVALVLLLPSAALADGPFSDALVQPPTIGEPERGSLAGQLSAEVRGASDLARGTVELPSPFAMPSDRGALLASPFPAYASDGGLTEWGLGWQGDLVIRRSRLVGHVAYDEHDERSSPWGRLAKGDDGAWYPVGLRSAVRVRDADGGMIAYLADGTRWWFGSRTIERTSEGVYAWYLDEVRSLDGQVTRFDYEEDSGRPWLRRVSWGGVDEPAHAAELVYEPVSVPTLSMRSGAPVWLSKRVRAVDVTSRHEHTRALVPRWSYTLSYEQDELGPAFYLTRVQRRFASGEDDTALTYTYLRPSSVLRAATLSPVDALAGIPSSAVRPDRSQLFDVDDDGLLDLEVAEDHALFRQELGRFVRQPAGSPSSADRACRPEPDRSNRPRLLARMHGPRAAVDVVALRTVAAGQRTELRLCDLDGRVRVREDLDGAWAPDANTRLVDLDGDEHPDLVHVGPGRVVVRAHRRGAAGEVFAAPARAPLSPVVQPDSTWLHDWNGDGIVDVVVRSGRQLVVWLGAGRGRIEGEGRVVPLSTSAGAFPGLDSHQLTFVDVNRDGLADAILTRSQRALLFVNDGRALVERALPGLSGVDWTSGGPVVADLVASGETELVIAGSAGARSLQLTRPGVALVATADDGRGSQMLFEYARAAPASGVGRRQVVLSRTIARIGGERPRPYDYAMHAPRVHTVARSFLGFDRVRRTGPDGWDEAEFANSDDAAGVLVSLRTHDARAPILDTVERRTHRRVTFRGVAFLRPMEVRDEHVVVATGVRIPGTATRYERYDGLCAVLVDRWIGPDRLRTSAVRARLPLLDDHLHCLEEHRVLEGRHARRDFDFEHRLHVRRDVHGLPLRSWMSSMEGELELQTVTYDDLHSPLTITNPATGTTAYAWSPRDHRLDRVVAHDGVVTRVASRDPVSGVATGIEIDRGGLRLRTEYRYDGQERLQASWDDVGDSDADRPDTHFAYRYASAERPGWWHVSRLVDGRTGSVDESFELAGPRGNTITTITRLASGWAFSPVALEERGHTRTLLRAPLSAARTPDDIRFDELDRDAAVVGESLQAGGGLVRARTVFHAGVEGTIAWTDAVVGRRRARVSLSSEGDRTELELDGAGRVVRRADPWGGVHRFEHDVLGRVREVRVAGGRRARVDYDGFGRARQIRWSGVASTTIEYDRRSGLRSVETWRGSDQRVRRVVRFEHDRSGRVLARHSRDLELGQEETFRYRYDRHEADLGGGLAIGLLTAIEGPRLRKAMMYGADGLVLKQRTDIEGWGRLESEHARYEDGRARRRSTTYEPAHGGASARQVLEWSVDRHARTRSLTVDGGVELALFEDAHGEAARATVDRWTIDVSRDPLTRLPVGLELRGPSTFDTAVSFGTRGAPVREEVHLHRATAVTAYDYGPGGLVRTASGSAVRRYTYGPDGVLVKQADVERDRLGRVTRHGDTIYVYGPGGHLSRAESPRGSATYAYDENGHRVITWSAGHAVVEADGVVVRGGVIETPATIGSRRIGVFAGSRFIEELSDARGSRRVGERTDLRDLGPYGESPYHFDRADYHGRPWDAASATVRFGERDYAPGLGAFLTPDLAFYSDPARCLDSPIECNLYGFALGSPTSHTDPTGRAGERFALSQVSDQLVRNRDDYRAWLVTQLTPETSTADAAGLVALTLSVELGVGLGDTLRFGEGMASGTARGVFDDALRAVAIVTATVKAVQAVRGVFKSLAGTAEQQTGAKPPPGVEDGGSTSGGSANTTRLGVKRTNASDWRELRDLWDRTGYGDILSEANRGRIAKGRTPVVDDKWVEHFPGDNALMGEKIPMHHIGGTPITVPLPETRHLDAHMPGGFRHNPGGPGTSG